MPKDIYIKFFSKYNWDFFSKAVILLFLTVMLIIQSLQQNKPMGEYAQFMASAVAMENRLSLQITPADIDRAKAEFPEYADSIQWHWDTKRFVKDAHDGSRRFSWYFPTYSIICIPMMKLLRVLELDPAYAFPLTNVLILSAALYYVFKKLKAERRTVFFTVLFLACSPIAGYLWWISAEVFIFSLIAVSIVNLLNGRHKKAAFYISLAGTLNIAAMVAGIAIILDCFWIRLAKAPDKSIRDKLKGMLSKAKVLDILKLAGCFFPFYVSAAFNLAMFKALTPTSRFADMSGWGGRFPAYLFDLNLGFLGYYNLALILFILIAAYGIIRKQREAIVFTLAFLGTTAVFSMEAHINSGMTGISRYCAWLSPMLVLYVCTQIPALPSGRFRLRGILTGVMSLSIALTAVTSAWTLTKPDHLLLTPMARAALTNIPSVYNPYKYIFISRVERTDGGYYDLWTHDKPIMYLMPDGRVRKILVPAGYDRSRTWLIGNQEHINDITKKMEKVSGKEYIYVNISRSWEIYPNE